MAWYVISMRSSDDFVVCRQDFEADSDEAAAVIGQVVFEACSDRAMVYEVWKGQDREIELMPVPYGTNVSGVIEQRQQSIVRLEETIRDSAWAIASSRSLLRELAAWRRYAAPGSSE